MVIDNSMYKQMIVNRIIYNHLTVCKQMIVNKDYL